MRLMMTIIMTLLGWQCMAQGTISGRVRDDKNELLINATIQAFQGGILKGGSMTDYDGQYMIKPLDPGYYDVIAIYPGYDSLVIKRVVVTPGNPTTLNLTMTRLSKSLNSVTVKAYKVPLINSDNPGSKVLSSEAIHRMPVQQTSDLVSTNGATYQQRRGEAVNVGGARTSGTVYYYGSDADGSPVAQRYDGGNESYKKINENDFRSVSVNPLSTMSVDVDRASYSNVRRFINSGQNPPADAVRIEEMINYFEYKYPQPTSDAPIAISTELTTCPWDKDHKLLRIGIQARKMNAMQLPASNLVFLIDVSGSMADANKLPLLIEGMKLLVKNLRPVDKVAIVTYAGAAGLVLPSTSGSRKEDILDALDRLTSGGATAGGEGIELAYKVAKENFVKGGNNRVILATDGDFNIGITEDNELEALISKQRSTGIYLSCLGFGMGNYKDAEIETLADKGNGNYSYIDNIEEAQKVLVTEFGGTLFTVAKDVKTQIEFNPARVQSYRMVGYENRVLNNEDFKDDKKDAGDMGAGHTVTMLYEIIPVGAECKHVPNTDSLKYQTATATLPAASRELATIKFRYKKPDEDKSNEIAHVIADRTVQWDKASENTRFPAAVAIFGMLLSDSKYAYYTCFEDAMKIARNAMDYDKEGYREEFVKLVKRARNNHINASPLK